MKRFASVVLFSSILVAATALVAQDARPQFNVIVVKHFTNAGKVNLPQDFVNNYCDSMVAQLERLRVADKVVAEGVAEAAGDAAGSITIEGKFTQYDPGGEYAAGQLDVLISIYRMSDGALMKTVPMIIPFRPFKPSSKHKNQNPDQYTGGQTAVLLLPSFRKITLPGVAAAPPAATHAAPSAAPVAAAPKSAPAAPAPSAAPAAAAPKPAPAATAPPAAPAPAAVPVAEVQISSDPSDAAILFDGKYVDSTPSVIKLAPGNHEITIKKKGFVDWKCQLTATGGNIHVNAELERAAPTPVTAATPQ